ncbi:hypothetical protein FJT64_016706 [Amphibalanus amphitrite]|uniref:Uncharacterized protein n=1 Tax=Amphibalanus amphitrite TaxID=1232801 RepID=A0A6A4WZQ5_AMPAM|nr:hypothetical protein FJT64_016706 [Amphibalanus amphitrite]
MSVVPLLLSALLASAAAMPGSSPSRLCEGAFSAGGNDQQLLQLQLNVECAFNRSQGRHCLLTEGATGSGLPVCDCAV